MLTLGAAGSAAYALLSLVLGVRLLLLARRTRQLPELLIGAMFLSGGVLANTLALLAPLAASLSPPLQQAWGLGLRIGIIGGCIASLFAAWRLFRPDAPWAGVLVGATLALLAPYAAPALFLGEETWRSPRAQVAHPLWWGWELGSVVAYGWTALESLRMQARIRRRWQLGLGGDLVLATRLRLWGVGIGCKAVMFALFPIQQLLSVLTDWRLVSSTVFVALCGLLCSLCLWLAFFPPKGYLAAIERRAAAAIR